MLADIVQYAMKKYCVLTYIVPTALNVPTGSASDILVLAERM